MGFSERVTVNMTSYIELEDEEDGEEEKQERSLKGDGKTLECLRGLTRMYGLEANLSVAGRDASVCCHRPPPPRALC